MKEMKTFLTGLGGSMVWVLMILIVLMVVLRWLASRKWPVVSTVAQDAKNLATAGSVSGS